MLKLKSDVLEQLKCTRCEGYLDVAPVMITPEKCQICGKCYKILPLEERKACVRQVAYETVAEMLLFPCRYHVYGCECQFAFNQGISHETECLFRFDASKLAEITEEIYEEVLLYEPVGSASGRDLAPSESKLNSPINFTILDTSQNVAVESTYILKENGLSNYPAIIKYNTCIFGNESKGSALLLTTAKFNHYIRNPIKICVDGAISSTTFRSVYCNVTICSVDTGTFNSEGEFSKMKSFRDLPKCVKCYEVVKKEVYYCTYGHDVCSGCKGANCILCTSPINLVPRYHCENFSKGCSEYLVHSELYLHSKNCEFNSFQCPIDDKCGQCNTLLTLKQHLRNYHKIDQNNTTTRTSSTNDETWIMMEYDNMFKCTFFYYEHQVEIIVELIGPQNLAEQFKYEVMVQSKQNRKIVKTAKCAKWQNSTLEECVSFTIKDMQQVKLIIEKFMYTLTIHEGNK
ncbi:hypothetical protein PPYR_04205 [Photinus pyralis]|uniref:SIAH-type domain-containing protein n=1 Tax=Photinus pyralis TaxID=7054 RepID=A0A5N4AXF1_PHOPY|nr:uncharacterized protein LOC116162941 [Photinus pyralis]XP_031334527.1 uncharacterized protein LOC116164483 [Photinus pyralis]KAB0802019.1 hypothetical protein PPYR_04205 [Photinus pyralis]